MKKQEKQSKTAVHIVDKELLQPYNPVLVNLIGAGGTGSHVLTALARLNHMLLELNHPGLMVRVFDNDRIEKNNRLRTLFASEETGMYKSVVVVNRNNRFFGTNWKAVTQRFDRQTIQADPELASAEITISCVDTVAARMEIEKILTTRHRSQRHMRYCPKYWLDYGNSKSTGQVVLSTIGKIAQPKSEKFRTVEALPMVTKEFKDLLKQSEKKDDTATCSTAGALEEQDLFINASLAYTGVELLKKMFREGLLFNRGLFLNLNDLRTQPLKVA